MASIAIALHLYCAHILPLSGDLATARSHRTCQMNCSQTRWWEYTPTVHGHVCPCTCIKDLGLSLKVRTNILVRHYYCLCGQPRLCSLIWLIVKYASSLIALNNYQKSVLMHLWSHREADHLDINCLSNYTFMHTHSELHLWPLNTPQVSKFIKSCKIWRNSITALLRSCSQRMHTSIKKHCEFNNLYIRK